ncbi:unnamed protein product [marine sediment metagenome]|uniref:Uncharacterized protein n=1 Tax=marine sediment metagenome TaxID=412755 RepID=X1ASB4_9ZZZZ
MAKTQRPKRLSTQDVSSKEAKEAVRAVANSVNNFMEEHYIAISGNLTIADNLNMEYKTIKLTTDGSGDLVRSVKFKSNLKTKVVGMVVVRTFISEPTTLPFCIFSENSGQVSITKIIGLAADSEYQLVIQVLGT